MSIIAIGAPKGGVGKSTIAINLAYLRAKEKGQENVILIDADSRTNSACVWASVRSEKGGLMPILVMAGDRGKSFLQQIELLKTKFSEIIIDIGGDNESELNVSMTKADKIYIPARPSYMDTFNLSKIDSSIEQARTWNPALQAFLLPSAVSPNPNMMRDDLSELKELTSELENVSLAQNMIYERKAFRRSIKFGKSIFELTTGKPEYFDPTAADEMNAFYEEVYSG